MTDFDSIWRTLPADYDGVGSKGTKFVFYM